jgi:Acetyltransferase (GNAT) domain
VVPGTVLRQAWYGGMWLLFFLSCASSGLGSTAEIIKIVGLLAVWIHLSQLHQKLIRVRPPWRLVLLLKSELKAHNSTTMASSSASPHQYPLVKLPHPFLTAYRVRMVAETTPAKFNLTLDGQPQAGRPLPQQLHHDSLSWLDLSFLPKKESPPSSNNSAWARARRSPQTIFQWEGNSPPSLGQIWNVIHAIYLAHPAYEYFRLSLLGAGKEIVRTEILSTGIGIEHPKPWRLNDDATFHTEDIMILRSAFWQGAASPTGPRPIWVVGDGTDGHLRQSLAQYPIMPENYHFTMKFPEEPIYTRHPIRRAKPHPGSIAYSRYIPDLDEYFSLEVVDWQDDGHLKLFNTWQNDPRVAKGWNETGTLEQHREYLRKLHFDPHVICLFGRFNESRFSYFELYWAKV